MDRTLKVIDGGAIK